MKPSTVSPPMKPEAVKCSILPGTTSADGLTVMATSYSPLAAEADVVPSRLL